MRRVRPGTVDAGLPVATGRWRRGRTSERWILDADVAWARIDSALARTQPDLLDQVRDAALIESYFPIYTTRLIRALWDQVDATSVFSVQLYESYKHFYVLNRYLELVDYRPISDDELVEKRRA